jgi:glucan endo-1,3-beta-D-glucosidase
VALIVVRLKPVLTNSHSPVSGANFGPSVASPQNAQTYWNEVACALFQQAHVFWYSYQDYNANPSFGVFDRNGNAIYAQNVSVYFSTYAWSVC